MFNKASDKKRIFTRFFAVLLTVAAILCAAPFVVLAEEDNYVYLDLAAVSLPS